MANEQDCIEEILIVDSSAAIKTKLNQVLLSNNFCGLCLSEAFQFTSIYTEMEIFGDFGIHNLTLEGIINHVFKNEVAEKMGHPQICSKCLRQVYESYLFLCNTNYNMKILTAYVTTLDTRVTEVKDTENLEKLVITLHHQETEKDILEPDQEIISVESGFKCWKCNQVISPYKIFKTHTSSHKWKTKKECKYCHELVFLKGYNEHLRSKHSNEVYSCHICNKGFRRRPDYNRHMKLHSNPAGNMDLIIMPTQMKTEKGGMQCQFCLKDLNEITIKTHKCKYSCPDCDIYKCIHFDYLLSCLTQMMMKTKFSCPEESCDYTCVKKIDFIAHLNKEHLDYHPFTCDICKQQFYSKYIMKNHILTYHQEDYICRYCDKDFSDNKHLYGGHEETCKAVVREFKCVKCVASFDTRNELKTHSLKKCKNFPCPLCNLKFDNDKKLSEHKNRVHNGIQMVYNYRTMECPVCNKKFETVIQLDNHTQIHGENVKWACDICNNTYATKRKLASHKSNLHIPVPCEICGKICTRSTIKTHLSIHGKERNITKYSCHVCGEIRNDKRSFEIHYSKHTERVECPECSKLIHEGRMKYHLLYHTRRKEQIAKDRLYTMKCDHCDFKAASNSALETHINHIHLKITPYSCNYCDKSFCGKTDLVIHVQSHTRIKEVNCEICNISLVNRSSYKKHMIKKHSDIRPFKCDLCSESFAILTEMKVHKIDKHSAKELACPVANCSSKFSSNRHMRGHVAKVHWKQKGKPIDPKQIEGLHKRFYYLFDDRRRRKIMVDDKY